jgi:hypothetical protein
LNVLKVKQIKKGGQLFFQMLQIKSKVD